MFFRFLGKFFFLFYICPRITREFRQARKFLNPIINEVILKEMKKLKEERAKSRENHPAGTRLS